MLKKTRNMNLAALGGLCVIFFLFAWENVQAVRLGYNIEKVRHEITDLEGSNTYLKKEIEASLSPEKLQAEASKLGMVYPDPGAMVTLGGAADQNLQTKGWLAKLW